MGFAAICSTYPTVTPRRFTCEGPPIETFYLSAISKANENGFSKKPAFRHYLPGSAQACQHVMPFRVCVVPEVEAAAATNKWETEKRRSTAK
jgi:hypothetical protein